MQDGAGNAAKGRRMSSALVESMRPTCSNRGGSIM
jgi:hypothetical protein